MCARPRRRPHPAPASPPGRPPSPRTPRSSLSPARRPLSRSPRSPPRCSDCALAGGAVQVVVSVYEFPATTNPTSVFLARRALRSAQRAFRPRAHRAPTPLLRLCTVARRTAGGPICARVDRPPPTRPPLADVRACMCVCVCTASARMCVGAEKKTLADRAPAAHPLQARVTEPTRSHD